MERPKNINEIYANAISKVGQELFSDFLSNLSRKRQASFLVSSVVTILLAFSIVAPKETQFLGVKFEFSDVNLIPFLFGLVTFYLGVTYLIGVIQDWQHAKYQRETIPIELDKISEELKKAKTEHENIVEKLKAEYDQKKICYLNRGRPMLKNSNKRWTL